MKKYLTFWNLIIIGIEALVLFGIILFMVLYNGSQVEYYRWFSFNGGLNVLGPFIFSIYIAVREYKDLDYSMRTYTVLVIGLMVMFGIGTSLVVDHSSLMDNVSNIPWFYLVSIGVFGISFFVGHMFNKRIANDNKIKINNKRGK